MIGYGCGVQAGYPAALSLQSLIHQSTSIGDQKPPCNEFAHLGQIGKAVKSLAGVLISQYQPATLLAGYDPGRTAPFCKDNGFPAVHWQIFCKFRPLRTPEPRRRELARHHRGLLHWFFPPANDSSGLRLYLSARQKFLVSTHRVCHSFLDSLKSTCSNS